MYESDCHLVLLGRKMSCASQQMSEKGFSVNKYMKDVKNKPLSLHMDLNLHRIDSLAVFTL